MSGSGIQGKHIKKANSLFKDTHIGGRVRTYLVRCVDRERIQVLQVNPGHVVQKHAIEGHVQTGYLGLLSLGERGVKRNDSCKNQ